MVKKGILPDLWMAGFTRTLEVHDLKLVGSNLLLFGFADEGAKDADLALSKQRAQAVAEHFEHRGVKPGVVTGFGSQLPVASSATEDGKEKKRRVEVWLRK